MSGKRIAVLDPKGKFATIDEADLDKLPDGARQLTKKEIAEHELEAEYAKKSTAEKVIGNAQAYTEILNPASAMTSGINRNASPTVESFKQGLGKGLSLGINQAATKKLLDASRGGAAGTEYANRLEDLETASPTASGAGEAVGTLAGAVAGGGPTGALGNLAERGVARGAARVLGSAAAETVGGRALTTAAELGVRGVVEGGAMGGVSEASRQMTHDPELSADKIFAGVGTGALFGGVTGAGLGAVGSLGKSAVTGAFRALSRKVETAGTGAAEQGAVATADEAISKARPAPFIDPDAGLAGGKFATESPISIGAEMRPMQLRPGGAIRKVPNEPAFDIFSEAKQISREGRVPLSEIEPQATWEPRKTEALKKQLARGEEPPPIRLVKEGTPQWQIDDGIHRTALARELGETSIPAQMSEYRHVDLIDPEAGIARRGQNGAFQGTIPTEPALRPSSAKNVPRRVGLDVGGEVPQLGGEVSPIRFPAAAAAEEAGPVAVPKSWTARKADELAFDALGGTKGQMTKAVQHVKGGAEAVGEYVNRIHIAPAAEGQTALGGAVSAGKIGRADQLLEAIQADKSTRIAKGLEGAIRGTPARFDLDTLTQDIAKMHTEMLRDPVRAAGADAFVGRINEEIAAIGRTPGRIASDGTIDAADAFQIRAALERKAYEVGGGTNSSAKDAYKQVLRQMDGHVVDVLDKAAADAGKGGVGDEIRHWKREWQLASAAEQVAEGGTERVRGNNTFGIRESIGGLVGLATGHPLLGMATAAAGKIARERGSAAGAQLLNHMSTSRGLASIVDRIDSKMNTAAHGLLSEPAKRPLPFLTESPRKVAQTAMRQIAAMQADPQGTAAKLASHVDEMSATHPEIAQALIARQTNALGFLASKAPTGGDPDPLDPHSAPRMSDADASTFAKFAFYSAKPERFFDELEHGKITPEGAETARALMPNAFAELQARMTDAIATHMARGRSVPFQQRLKIGNLIGIEATPSQKPEHMQFLQSGLAEQQNPKPPMPGGTAKMTMGAGKAQTSALDGLAGGIGKRRGS